MQVVRNSGNECELRMLPKWNCLFRTPFQLHTEPEFVSSRSLSFRGNCLRTSFGVFCCGFILVWLTGRLHLSCAGGHVICTCSSNMRSFPITTFFLIRLHRSKYVFSFVNKQLVIADLWEFVQTLDFAAKKKVVLTRQTIRRTCQHKQ